MNKIFITAFIFVIVVFVGYFAYQSVNKTDVQNRFDVTEASPSQPDRQDEVNGYILSNEGNEVSVANEVGIKEISDEERAKRQQMTQEERQALKASETANLAKENVTLVIPVGTTIVKGSGDSSGTNVTSSLEEMSKGVYVSIWKNGEDVEFVKLKGVSQ